MSMLNALGAPALRAWGTHRQYEKPRLGSRIPHPDFSFLRQADTEIREHAAGILYRPGTIWRGLIPDRRQAQHFPRVTGAQRAHDNVVARRRVLDGDEVIADPADMAERTYGLGGVFQQCLPEGRVGPGFGDDLGAIVRADFGFV